jgi:hypothetical protein
MLVSQFEFFDMASTVTAPVTKRAEAKRCKEIAKKAAEKTLVIHRHSLVVDLNVCVQNSAFYIISK